MSNARQIRLNPQDKADLCTYTVMASMAVIVTAVLIGQYGVPFEVCLSIILMAGPPYWYALLRLRLAALGRKPFTDDTRNRFDERGDGGSAAL